MKIFSLIIALLFLAGALPARADNGVERGDLTFGKANIPECVQALIKKQILGSCDLKGALVLAPTYLLIDKDMADTGQNVVKYVLQYEVRYATGPIAIINAGAMVNTDAAPENAVSVLPLDSKICR